MVLCRAPRFALHCEDGCEMADAAKWQLLVVDDDCEICQEVQEFLGRETITELDGCPEVQTLIDFDEALPMLATRRFDLLILDVREGSHSDKREEEKGTETLKDIRQRCFIPVVFYTGLPGQVSHLESPFVKIAEKTDGLPSLLEKIKAIFETRSSNSQPGIDPAHGNRAARLYVDICCRKLGRVWWNARPCITGLPAGTPPRHVPVGYGDPRTDTGKWEPLLEVLLPKTGYIRCGTTSLHP